MSSEYFTLSATVWNNYLMITSCGQKGLVYDPISFRKWPLPRSRCRHAVCELKEFSSKLLNNIFDRIIDFC